MPGQTLLVVEDDADARAALVYTLETLGYRARAFGDPYEALTALRADPTPGTTVDLALLDIMLPGMDGYELLEEFKKLPGYENVPVIMVTARDGDSDIVEGYRYGADYYITKPFTTKQLEYGIRMFLS